MDWLNSLFFGTGVPHSIFILTLAIAGGISLSHHLKFKGITLGITWILFCAIAMSHFGMHLDPMVETFAKDFGLILFVYSIGLQVGPSFFSSFGKGGIKLNMLALSIVLLGCVTAYVISLLSGVDIATMTGVLFGAVTNTPGLGAAQQAFADITGNANPNIASGYAMAYPLGVVGIITVILAMRWFFRIKLDKEEARVAAESEVQKEVQYMDVLLTNPQVEGAHIRDLSQLVHMNLIVSRLVRPDGEDELPDVDTVLHVGDRIRVVVDKENTIEVLDRVTRKRIKQISTTAMLGLKEGTSPRRIIAGGNSIFFTTYGGVVARVDTLAFNLQNKYTVGSYPEGLMGAGNYLYVANSDYGNGNGTFSIVDLASGSVNTLKVEGVNNPKEFFLTQSNLYVLDMGTYDANWNQTGCGIYRMNGNSSATLVAEATMAAQYGEKLYLINNAYGTVTEPVYSVYDTSSGSLTALKLSEKVESPADIKVDPVTGHIFVLSYQMGDYGYADYNANGYAVEYDAQGNKLRRYDTGVGPTTMFFDAGIRTEEVK